MTFDPVSIGSLALSGVVLGALLRYRAQTFEQFKARDKRIDELTDKSADCEKRYGELKGYVEGVRAGVSGLDVLAQSNAQLVAVVRDSMRVKTGRTDIPSDLQDYLRAIADRSVGSEHDTPVEIPNPRKRDPEKP